MLLGTITGTNSSGLTVYIDVLKADYGSLSYIGEVSTYTTGVRVVVGKVGPDEYVVLGAVHP